MIKCLRIVQMMERDLYEALIDNMGEGVIFIDDTFKIRLFNQKAEELIGIPRSHVIGSPLHKALPLNPWIREMVEKVFKEGYTIYDHEKELKRPDGVLLPVGISASPVYLDEGVGGVVVIKDLSTLRPLIEEDRRKERLAFLGTLTAGIAHEVRNPLSGIRGAIQLLLRRLKEENLREYALVIREEVERIERILERLLTFSNSGNYPFGPVNIHEVLDHSIAIFLEEARRRGIACTKIYDPSIPPVRGDRDSLVQVFVNLIKNSLEAIEEKGTIEVRTKVVHETLVSGGKEKKMVSIEIVDNGKGIDEEGVIHAFTPFYSTKEGGTGLGLPISLKIVHEHGGLMRIERLPKGTKVSVFLPLPLRPEERKGC